MKTTPKEEWIGKRQYGFQKALQACTRQRGRMPRSMVASNSDRGWWPGKRNAKPEKRARWKAAEGNRKSGKDVSESEAALGESVLNRDIQNINRAGWQEVTKGTRARGRRDGYTKVQESGAQGKGDQDGLVAVDGGSGEVLGVQDGGTEKQRMEYIKRKAAASWNPRHKKPKAKHIQYPMRRLP